MHASRNGFTIPGMSRTDRRGRGLKVFLQAEIAHRDISVEELLEATGITPGHWYNDKRKKTPGRSGAADFPNEIELKNVAHHYELGDDGFLNLLVEFGLIEPRPDLPGFTQGGQMPPFTVLTDERRVVTTTGKLSKLAVRRDAPPL